MYSKNDEGLKFIRTFSINLRSKDGTKIELQFNHPRLFMGLQTLN